MRPALAILLSLSACASEYTVRVSFESPDLREASTRVGVAVVQSCTDANVEGTLRAVIQDVEFGVDESAGPLGALDPGSYGLLARAWNDDCELMAAACRPITVEAGGSETLTIQMLARNGRRCAPERECNIGVCEGARDGSVGDASVDSPRDASRETGIGDAGIDVVREVSIDAPGEGGIDDVGPPSDALGDAGPDGSSGTFCSRHGAGSYGCLDFEEDPALSGWMFDEDGATFTDDSSGVTGNAARVTGGAPGSASIKNETLGVHSAGTMWLRAKVRVEAPESTNIDFMTLFVIHDPNGAPFSYMAASLLGARRLQLSHDATVASTPAGEQYPVGEWFCVELEFDNGPAGSMTLHVDGRQVVTEAVTGDSLWSQVLVGARGIGDMQAVATYLIDDFVWSSERVPCALE